MAEPTTQTEALPEKGPWSMSWQDVAKASGNIIDTVKQGVQEAVKKVTGPWDMDWNTLRKTAKGNEPVEAPKPQQLDFETVFSRLINAESGGTHSIKGKLLKSKAGAEGITQVMPKTSGNPGYGVTPVQDRSEAEYKRFGRDYLKAMLKEFDGDYEKALAAYNAGVGNVKKAISKDAENWKDHLPKRSETLPYIEKILNQKVVQKEVGDRFIEDKQYPSLSASSKRGLKMLDEAAQSNPEFRQVQEFLKSVGGLPKLEAGYSSANGSFTRGSDYPPEGVIQISGLSTIDSYRQDGKGVNRAYVSTYLHEHTHAAVYQMKLMAEKLEKKKDPTPSEYQFLDTFKKMIAATKATNYENAFKLTARAINDKWTSTNEGYRASMEELPAFGMGNTVVNTTGYSTPQHLDPSIAQMFMILLDQAKKVVGK